MFDPQPENDDSISYVRSLTRKRSFFLCSSVHIPSHFCNSSTRVFSTVKGLWQGIYRNGKLCRKFSSGHWCYLFEHKKGFDYLNLPVGYFLRHPLPVDSSTLPMHFETGFMWHTHNIGNRHIELLLASPPPSLQTLIAHCPMLRVCLYFRAHLPPLQECSSSEHFW